LKGIIRIIFIAVLTIVLLVLFLRNSDASQVMAVVRSTNPLWLLVGFAANFLALVARAERWRTILNPADPPGFYPTFFSTALGFMSSALLPVRAGDVIRPALLSRRTSIRFSTAFGTVVTERVLDLFSILLLFLSFVVMTMSDPSSIPRGRLVALQSGAVVAGGILTAALVLVIGLHFFHGFVRRAHEWLSRFLPQRIRASWMRFFDSFVASLGIVRNRPAFLKVVLLTATIWTGLTAQYYFVLLAMRHPLPFSATFLISGAAIVGLAIPTPGGVGGFHKAAQIVLTGFYGLTVSASVAVALAFHLVGTAPVIVTGLVLFLRERLSWRQLARIGEKPEE
jgi:glycosyltransferase 2 family protein